MFGKAVGKPGPIPLMRKARAFRMTFATFSSKGETSCMVSAVLGFRPKKCASFGNHSLVVNAVQQILYDGQIFRGKKLVTRGF